MASACVNNNVRLLPENLFDSPPTDWFNPRSDDNKPSPSPSPSSPTKPSEDILDLDYSGGGGGGGDFEFRLNDPVKKMLPADELFSDGKLMPLHVSTARVAAEVREETTTRSSSVDEILKSKVSSLSGMDPYLFSPKAPRCSSGWRELLGLKKLQNTTKHDNNNTKTPSSSKSSNLKHFMHRNPKFDPSLGLPLLKETDSSETESVEIARVSLDSHKSNSSNPKRNHHHHHHPPKVRLVRRVPDSPAATQTPSASASALGVSIDSPRMNSSGKVVFQSLERSSSSPSTFNGGPRVKYKGMERRSYSANVKVSPVLNVPVCSLRGSSKFGLGQLFPSPHKKASSSSTTSTSDSNSTERSRHHHQQQHQPSTTTTNNNNKQKPLP